MGGKALRPKSSKQGYVIILIMLINLICREIIQAAKRGTPSNISNISQTLDKAIKTLSVIIALHNSRGQSSLLIITVLWFLQPTTRVTISQVTISSYSNRCLRQTPIIYRITLRIHRLRLRDLMWLLQMALNLQLISVGELIQNRQIVQHISVILLRLQLTRIILIHTDRGPIIILILLRPNLLQLLRVVMLMLLQFWRNITTTCLESCMGMTEVHLRRWVIIHLRSLSIKSHSRHLREIIMKLIYSSSSSSLDKGQCLEEQLLELIRVEHLAYQLVDLMEWGLNTLEVEGLEMIKHQHNSSNSSSHSKISFRTGSIANNSSICSSSQRSKMINLIRIIAATHQWGKIFQNTGINLRVDNSSNLLERRLITRLNKVEIQSQAKFKSHQRSSLSLIRLKDFNSSSSSSSSSSSRNHYKNHQE